MKKHSIRLEPLGKEIEVNDKTPFIDVLHEFGIEFPCGGKGTCGKCKVRVLKGEVKISEIHRQKLDQMCLSDDWRLACYSLCTGDIILEIEQFNYLILADESKYEFSPLEGFGIAVDLGTTTVVAQLIDLSTAKVLAVETILNPQVKFGADLISRIQACLDGHANELTDIIRSAIGILIELMLKKNNVIIQNIVLVGNTVMHHIFSGLDLTPLSSYPFQSKNLCMRYFNPETLGWNFQVMKKVQFFPSIGSFVGSDILAGIAATGLHLNDNYEALIDLGTNGEIVVGNKHRIVCASTAAGPAFEGSNVSMGMRAVTGAISSLNLINGKLEAKVIGNTAAKGICGSALVDAIAIFHKMNMIGMCGEISSGEKSIALSGKVSISQNDINEFQFAKAAIAAGLTILVKTLSIQLADIQKIYIAGGFGNYINVANLVEIGMIELPEDKIRKMGNTALIGAKMFLFSDNEIIDEIISKTRHVNLESDPDFQDIYVDKMFF